MFHRAATFLVAGLCLLIATGMTCPAQFVSTDDPQLSALFEPAPMRELDTYDLFGKALSQDEARQMVVDAGMDPEVEDSYLRLGLVHYTQELIEKGRTQFLQGQLGDPFSISNIISFASEFGKSTVQSALDSLDPTKDPDGTATFLRDVLLTCLLRPKDPTTNLEVTLTRDLHIGSTPIPAGTVMRTGLDVQAGNFTPVGFDGGAVSCAICHASVDTATGREVVGRANTDLDIGLFLALSPNSAGAFIKVNRSDFDPMDPRFPRTGRTIINSMGENVTLPDPIAYETAMDDFLLSMPKGTFDAGPDSRTSLVRVPDNFVIGEGGMGWDGGFNIGPFGGVTAFSSAVHSFELSMSSPFFSPESVLEIDPEVFLGVILQNAADPALRIPDGVRPSVWLKENFPLAERERLMEIPSFPDPTLFSLNGLVFNPPGERVMESANALAAFQTSLNVPPNRTPENFTALISGAVQRGGEVFLAAKCNECHIPPFFTDRVIHTSDELGVNPVRGKARNSLEGRLVAARLPAFDLIGPLPADAPMLDLPPAEGTDDNLHLPPGLSQMTGGYKTTGLRGAYLNGPYLHDIGVAVHPDALRINLDGSYTILDESLIGVSKTRKIAEPVSAAHSMRALIDRDLRAICVANNRADADLARSNVEGVGHDFFVDPQAGFTYQQQADLVAFLLALDDNPGAF